MLELSRALRHPHLEFIADFLQHCLSLFALRHIATNTLYPNGRSISIDEPGTYFKWHTQVVLRAHFYFICRPGSACFFRDTLLSTMGERVWAHKVGKTYAW